MSSAKFEPRHVNNVLEVIMGDDGGYRAMLEYLIWATDNCTDPGYCIKLARQIQDTIDLMEATE